MATVLLVSDYACPWCYLGHQRLRGVLRAEDEVKFVAFPLSPDTPAEGRNLAQYLAARGVPIADANARLSALMQEAGLPWNTAPDRMAWNTRRAQELAMWAEDRAPGIHDALFRAVQVDNVNVYDIEVLAQIGASVGLDPDATRAFLSAGEGAARVDRDWTWARQIGIRSVPTFIVGQRAVAGAQSADVLRQLLASA